MNFLEVFKCLNKLFQVILRNVCAIEPGTDHFSQAVFHVISLVNLDQMISDRAIFKKGLCVGEKCFEVVFKVIRQPGKGGFDFSHLFHKDLCCVKFI